MNKIILIGNVGKDPETKQVNNNVVSKFSLATSEYYKDKDGNKQTETQWHNIVVWNKENLMNYINKGSKIAIEGKISYREYESDGQKKYFTEITAFNIELLGGKSEPKKEQKDDNFNDVPDLNSDKTNIPF